MHQFAGIKMTAQSLSVDITTPINGDMLCGGDRGILDHYKRWMGHTYSAKQGSHPPSLIHN
jgi:hypothetical protein